MHRGITDDPAYGSSSDVPTLPPRLRILPAEQWALLLTNSISLLPLHKTLTLLDILNRNNDERYALFDFEESENGVAVSFRATIPLDATRRYHSR